MAYTRKLIAFCDECRGGKRLKMNSQTNKIIKCKNCNGTGAVTLLITVRELEHIVITYDRRSKHNDLIEFMLGGSSGDSTVTIKNDEFDDVDKCHVSLNDGFINIEVILDTKGLEFLTDLIDNCMSVSLKTNGIIRFNTPNGIIRAPDYVKNIKHIK